MALSPEQLAFYEKNGYLLLPGFASKEECQAMMKRMGVSALWLARMAAAAPAVALRLSLSPSFQTALKQPNKHHIFPFLFLLFFYKQTQELVDAFDPSTVSVFSTRNQKETTDQYFLDSANNVSFFFEEKAFGPDGGLVQPKNLCINKVRRALNCCSCAETHVLRLSPISFFPRLSSYTHTMHKTFAFNTNIHRSATLFMTSTPCSAPSPAPSGSPPSSAPSDTR
jgi:hypothetical protein